MALRTAALASRFEGRLFSEEGRLYFVLDVDTDSGIARVSFSANGRRQVIEMPIAEIAMRLSAGPNLLLDGMSSTDKSDRIFHQSDGWFFTTRDGVKGPYASEMEATLALNTYILSAQSG